MEYLKDPAERTTAVTDIILAVVAFVGVVFLRGFILNSCIIRINSLNSRFAMVRAELREQ
jgi:uncharacterized membrane protein